MFGQTGLLDNEARCTPVLKQGLGVSNLKPLNPKP